MRKIYILLISLIFVAGNAFSQVNVDIKKAIGAPTIDGTEETGWDGIDPVALDKNLFTEVPDVTAYWKACWNDTAVFVLMNVEDDDWYPAEESGGNNWEYDKDESYFDLNDTLADGDGPITANSGHWQIAAEMFDSLQGIATHEIGWAGHNPNNYHSWVLTGENHVREWRVPIKEMWNKNFDTLGSAANPWEVGRLLGFDSYTIDRDEDMTGRTRKVWQQDGKTAGDEHEAWESMDHSGTITLSATTVNFSGINKVKTADIRVFPNPVADYVTVTGVDFDNVVIANILGQEVMTLTQIRSNRFDVANLTKGIYVVKVYKGEKFLGSAKINKN